MKICIVDDEQNCIDDLHSLLFWYAKEKNIDVSFYFFNDGDSFLKAYKPEYYDIVFLDIYIGETTGMKLAEAIRKQSENGMIIFCTTSINDMPQAFRFHAFEYIIKPPDFDRIKHIMDDAIAILPKLEKYIDLQSGSESIKLAVSNIMYAVSSGHYLEINLRGGESHSVRTTMAQLKEKLADDERFLSINKGVIVNMDYIKNIADKNCMMNDDTALPIKIREVNNIKQHWQNYSFEQIRKGQKIRI